LNGERRQRHSFVESSRPGDSIYLQALTDLVAVSTACPADVDPINGWNPIDLHVCIHAECSAIPHSVALP